MCLWRQALGLQPKKRKVAQQPQLSPAELAELMRKARGEGEEEPAVPGEEADRVKGLGYRPCAHLVFCSLRHTDSIVCK